MKFNMQIFIKHSPQEIQFALTNVSAALKMMNENQMTQNRMRSDVAGKFN